MSTINIFFIVWFLLLTHVGFFIAGFSFAVKLVNREVNK